MARTRAQEQAQSSKQNSVQGQSIAKGKAPKKRLQPNDTADEEHRAPPAKATKKTEKNKVSDPKLKRILDGYGTFPLEDAGLAEPEKPTAETMLAHLLHAQLVAARISHQIAARTFHEIMKAGYANLSTLEKSSWEQRTEILTKAGYTHYREKTATELGGLAKFVRERYDGDLSNLYESAKSSEPNQFRSVVRKGLKEIKGVGEVALDVFCDTAQGLWRELAPFLDARSLKTALQLGLTDDLGELYDAVGKDPVTMCRLSAALATVRLKGLRDHFA